MAEQDICRATDDFYDTGTRDREESVLRQEPHIAAYIDTYANLNSGDADVVTHELAESLAMQAEALERKNPALFRRVSAFLAIQNTTQELLSKEVA